MFEYQQSLLFFTGHVFFTNPLNGFMKGLKIKFLAELVADELVANWLFWIGQFDVEGKTSIWERISYSSEIMM